MPGNVRREGSNDGMQKTRGASDNARSRQARVGAACGRPGSPGMGRGRARTASRVDGAASSGQKRRSRSDGAAAGRPYIRLVSWPFSGVPPAPPMPVPGGPQSPDSGR
jgi:hypothetical protein